MEEKNLFSDVKVPEDVTRKMNDAYASIRLEDRKKKKARFKVVKTFTAIAASVAVVIVSVGAINLGRNVDTEVVKHEGSLEQEEKFTNTGNPFVIKAYAAELTEGMPFAFGAFGEDSGVGYATGSVQGELKVPDVIYANIMPNITVAGENIATVTYTVSGATFAVDFIKEESIIKACTVDESFVGNWYYQGYGEVYDERVDDKVSCEEEYYSSYTIDYANQSNPRTLVSIVKPYFNENFCRMAQVAGSLMTTGQQVAMFNDIWKDVELTITVNYQDGTQYTRQVVFEAVEQINNFGVASEVDFMKCKGDPTPQLGVRIVEGYEDIMEPRVEETELRYAGNGGIEFSDMITVDIKKINPQTNEEQDLGQDELWVNMEEPQFGTGYISYDQDGRTMGYSKEELVGFIKRVNSIIGTQVGETFSIDNEDGYTYRYTVKRIVHLGDEAFDNSKYYSKYF